MTDPQIIIGPGGVFLLIVLGLVAAVVICILASRDRR